MNDGPFAQKQGKAEHTKNSNDQTDNDVDEMKE